MLPDRFCIPGTIAGTIASIMLLLWTGSVSAVSIYRCNGADGVEYADTPCEHNPETVEIKDNRLGGSFLGDGRAETAPQEQDERRETDAAVETPEASSPCRLFQSTDLRTYLIREQVVPGMTRSHVREAWGAPVDAYAGPIEMWTYDNSYHGRLITVTRVYFEDGCVTEVETVKP